MTPADKLVFVTGMLQARSLSTDPADVEFAMANLPSAYGYPVGMAVTWPCQRSGELLPLYVADDGKFVLADGGVVEEALFPRLAALLRSVYGPPHGPVATPNLCTVVDYTDMPLILPPGVTRH